MDIQIIAPSYHRALGVITQQWLPEVTLLVMESEADAYRKQGWNILTCPDHVQGNISRVRNYILDNRAKDRVLILDDDIEGVKRWEFDGDAWSQQQMGREDFLEFIELGFDMAEEWGVKLWGINCMVDKGSYREYTPFSCKSFMSAAFHGHLDPELRYDEKIPLKEDYDFCIQNLREYRATLRFNMVSMVKRDHGNAGGCAVYRTIEREKEQLALLQKKWGSRIIQNDLGGARVTRTKKESFDLNPIMRVPIPGI